LPFSVRGNSSTKFTTRILVPAHPLLAPHLQLLGQLIVTRLALALDEGRDPARTLGERHHATAPDAGARSARLQSRSARPTGRRP
jgi:hypothetical protein